MKMLRVTCPAVLLSLAVMAVTAPTLRAQGGYTPSDKPPNALAEIKALDGFTILGTTVGYVRTDRFLKFMSDAEAGVTQKGMFEGRGPLAILVIVFLGGLALNLTPCVLPMIPINLAIIGAGTKSGSRGRGFLLGGVYGAAMAAVYGILGAIVILTAGSFGQLNASPWFNTGIAVLFIALGLAMFDVITIDFSRFSSRLNVSASRGSFYLAFGMGAIAALLAGACVAPVIIQVVLLSSNLYSAGTTVALGLPFVLGLGMALPWPIAGAGLAALPKPGTWMVHVKHAFGVVILATAVYYGYQAYGQFKPPLAAASTVKDGWYTSLSDALVVAQRENRRVFVDMWATWCKNCFVMDETTFEQDAVKAAMDKYVLVKFQAEDPETQPAKALMDRFESVGLPTYAILQPK